MLAHRQSAAARYAALRGLPMSGQPCSLMPDDGRVLTPEVAAFGDQVTEVLARTLGSDLVGMYFVGCVAFGRYVPGESDVDIAAGSESPLTEAQKHRVASAIVEVSGVCPAW